MPYVPLEADAEPEAPVSVNITPAPGLSYEQHEEAVSPTLKAHVEAVRAQGLKQFHATRTIVGGVLQTAVESLVGAVPAELKDAKAIADPQLRDAFVEFHRATSRRQVAAVHQALDAQLAQAEQDHAAALTDLPSRRVRAQDLG